MDFTPFVRRHFVKRALRTLKWERGSRDIQLSVLAGLVSKAESTEFGLKHHFSSIDLSSQLYDDFRQAVECHDYEHFRGDVMRMAQGEANVLWPGVCRRFAQSSGTTGGKSKFIPITKESLSLNHYRGAEDAVAHYLALNPHSRIFSGKGMILGGSFGNFPDLPRGVKVGDLSATLIELVTPLAEMVRVPSKRVALMGDWSQKLPALARTTSKSNVTNISGVPSWFMRVIKEILSLRGASSLSEVWPNLEVFFHGGISFAPYREEYRRLTAGCNMHFLETYNASEGFFATQNDFDDPAMLLIIDAGIFYEFIPLGGTSADAVPLWETKPGKVYELVITAPNGLWRYRLGDTVRVESIDPVKITIAGRTKAFINAFGEELMEANAEKAMAEACRQTGASVLNYTAGPVYAEGAKKGRHEWIIEWGVPPADTYEFARILDAELQRVNSDYEAKRAGSIFLDMPAIVTARSNLFDEWMRENGSGRLGGQRKIPRLSNDRHILDSLEALQNC